MGCGSSSDVLQEHHQKTFESALESSSFDENLENIITSKVDVNMKIHNYMAGTWYPIHIASKAGNIKAVSTLIKCGADLLMRDEKGQTALHIAIKESHVDIIDTLLQAGADINAKTEDGKRPLDLAIEMPNLQIVDKLLEYNPDVNGDDSASPLSVAAKLGQPAIVESLLKAKADPNSVKIATENGEIDLWSWAENGNEQKILDILGSKQSPDNVKSEDSAREGGDGEETVPSLDDTQKLPEDATIDNVDNTDTEEKPKVEESTTTPAPTEDTKDPANTEATESSSDVPDASGDASADA